ncbi:MAG: hypothetical protein FRX49_03663 [Trebouxia sp. A1-2]|nr:MAG: hypothetical protein FRX49_03663 [Trebouxia sp. A1-2]
MGEVPAEDTLCCTRSTDRPLLRSSSCSKEVVRDSKLATLQAQSLAGSAAGTGVAHGQSLTLVRGQKIHIVRVNAVAQEIVK